LYINFAAVAAGYIADCVVVFAGKFAVT